MKRPSPPFPQVGDGGRRPLPRGSAQPDFAILSAGAGEGGALPAP